MKANPKPLGSVESFLKNRGWVIFSTADIKEAFTYLVKNKPSFVMVPADHPLKKIRSLPKLLTQAFPVCIIGYAESSTTHSYKMLMDSGIEYKINPPATGPAVERAVNKFMKDQQTLISKAESRKIESDLLKEVQEKIQQNKIDAQAASFLNFRDGENQAPATILNFETDSKSAETAVQTQEAAFLDSSKSISDTESSDDLAELLKQIVQTSRNPEELKLEQKKQSKGAAYTPNHKETKEQSSFFNPQAEILTPEESSVPAKNVKNKAKETSEASTGPKPGDHQGPAIPTGELKAKAKPINKGFVPEYHEDDLFDDSGALKQLDAPVLDFDLKSKKPAVVSSEIDSSEAQLVEGSSKEKHSNKTLKNPQEKSCPQAGHSSLISQGVEKALNQSASQGDGQIKNKLAASSNVACIVIESARFSGYLVAAMGKNRQIDQKFIDLIKDRLGKFLKEQGEETIDGGLNIKIKEVDFEGWALEYADFLRKSIHNGDELAMAFFPFSPIKNELGQSAAAEMGAIKLEDLHGDLEVEFSLYIYLSANNRYVLYTPKGSKFYVSQKDRLAKMGVTHLHIRKSEAQDLSKYRAQNYLNSKILEYEQKKGLARSA